MKNEESVSISVFGLGYVGSVTAACLCGRGFSIVGVDIAEAKVKDLTQGVSPVSEPEVDDLLGVAVKQGRLSATTDPVEAVMATRFTLVCVGTPSLESGGLDLCYVNEVCLQIAKALKEKQTPHVLMLRSTMLPGSTQHLYDSIFSELVESGLLEIIYCPEFLREGTAVSDFKEPSLSVLGTIDGGHSKAALEVMGDAHWFDWKGAELIKYACNYWHALKVCFANEIGRIGKQKGIDSEGVMCALVSDIKLNVSPYYMRPGNPFGGSCLPKDVLALCSMGRESGLDLPVLENVMSSNNAHLIDLVRIVTKANKKKVLINHLIKSIFHVFIIFHNIAKRRCQRAG